jgi:putative membrane-bound dehydrogenase-like protein
MLCQSRWLLLVLVLPLSTAWAQGPGAPPRPPREEHAAFVLADPDLTIELVASEPEVASPVAIAWDEDGRLFVAEMLDYPTASTSGRVRMLEDRDGDGRYERATVFADGLPFPNGVLPCFGGVLVTAAPNIWFLRDKDGDGRAEEKAVVLTGFAEGNT